jgi:hypothetical protein
MTRFSFSPDTAKKVDEFNKADAVFKATWEDFAQKHAAELDHLERLREERNAKLDESKRALRREIEDAPISDVKSAKHGQFTALKRWSSFYSPEKLVAKLENKGVYDEAIKAKIIAERVEVEKFDIVQAFLKERNLVREFEDCEDGQEISPAIYGPKPIPPLAAELKESK